MELHENFHQIWKNIKRKREWKLEFEEISTKIDDLVSSVPQRLAYEMEWDSRNEIDKEWVVVENF